MTVSVVPTGLEPVTPKSLILQTCLALTGQVCKYSNYFPNCKIFFQFLKISNPASDLDLYFNSARKLKFHEGIHSLLCRLIDVKQAAVRVELELLA